MELQPKVSNAHFWIHTAPLQFQDPVCPHHVSFKNLDALSKSKSTKSPSLYSNPTWYPSNIPAVHTQASTISPVSRHHRPSRSAQRIDASVCQFLKTSHLLEVTSLVRFGNKWQYGRMKTGGTKQVELDDIGDIVVWIMRPRLLFPGP